MNKDITKEGNRLLAEFVGHSFPMSSISDYKGRPLTNYHYSKIRYHRDWNLLMRVVEKIESIYDDHHGYFGVHISSNSCSIQGTMLHKAIAVGSTYGPVYMSDPNAILDTKIESTWYNVVEFVKWHNKNNQQ